MEFYNFLFFVFSGLLIAGSCGVIFARNTVYSVLFLIFSFFNAAGIFILLGAEFIAATLIIVYVGAIAVLFLFVVMMLNLNYQSIKNILSKHCSILAMFVLAILAELLFVIYHSNKIKPYIAKKVQEEGFEQLSNSKQIGSVIYTEYFWNFELVGMALFLAMVGAILLTHRKAKNVRRQNIADQIARRKEDSIEIIKSVKVGHGVDPIRK